MSQIVKGNLPITIWKKEQENAIDYRVYGTANGSGVETENLWDSDITNITLHSINAQGDLRQAFVIDAPGTYAIKCYVRYGYVYGKTYSEISGEYSNMIYLSVPESSSTPTAVMTATIQDNEKIIIFDASSSSQTNPAATVEKFDASELCVVLGSTAPASYIPPGYKIPLSLESGANLWDKSQRDFSTDTILDDGGAIISVGGFGYDRNYTPCEPETDYVISGTIVTSSTSMRLYFFDKDRAFISRSDGYGQPTIPKKFTTPANCYYVTFQAYLSTYDPDTIMITKGSTAPASYIPHNYTDDYNLYIGDTKLGDEEYVDYGEQKIYKRTANYFPFVEAGVYSFGDDATVVSDGKGNFIVNGTIAAGKHTDYIPLPSICIAKSETTTIYLGNNQINSDLAFLLFDPDITTIELRSGATSLWKTVSFPDMNPVKYLMFQNKGSTTITVQNFIFSPMYSENGNLTEYIPYLQPTDPPAPFPAIIAYNGENTLSSTETVGNVSLEFNEATFYAGNSITQVYTNNQPYDLIDSSFYSLIANNYDSTQIYETDSYCIYNYCLYKCITAITVPEAFNPAKWQQLTLVDFIQGGA